MHLIPILVALFLASGSLFGQLVMVDVISNRDQFIPGEALQIGVRIANQSGRPIHLGLDDRWLEIVVQDADGNLVPQTGKLPVVGEIKIENSTRVTRRFNLTQAVPLTKPGKYVVHASVRIREAGWSEDVGANPLIVNVFAPRIIWKETFGIPPAAGRDPGPPQTRTYALEQVHCFKTKMKLYLRITDQTGDKTYSVQQIDDITNFSKWYADVDGYGNLHVLHQTPRAIARAYSYVVFSPYGEMLIRQTHNVDETQPRLYASESGLIRVRGGVRVPNGTDLPKPEDRLPPPDFTQVPKDLPSLLEPPSNETKSDK